MDNCNSCNAHHTFCDDCPTDKFIEKNINDIVELELNTKCQFDVEIDEQFRRNIDELREKYIAQNEPDTCLATVYDVFEFLRKECG